MSLPEISPLPFRSFDKLSSMVKLVGQDEIAAKAGSRGLELVDSRTRRFISGNDFFEMIFRAGEK